MSQQDFPFTEQALLTRFAARYCRDIRYSPDHKCFFIYDGKGWIRDDTMITENRASRMIVELVVISERESNITKKTKMLVAAATFQTYRTIQNMVQGVKPLITISADELKEDSSI